MRKISIFTLIFALFIPILTGGISAALTGKAMEAYGTMSKPPLSPPAWIFPVAWTILYLMMGLASYYVMVSEEKYGKIMALVLYFVQLAMNFMWSIIFFNRGQYMVAFIWLMIMWGIVIVCSLKFYNLSRIAGFLMIPYILWLTFAAYLNLGTFIVNS